MSLVWGTLLLTFAAADQVDALAEAFADCQGAARRIPERPDPKLLNIEIGDQAHLPAISVGFREISECGVSTHTLTPAPLGPRGTRPATSSARDGSTGSASWRPP